MPKRKWNLNAIYISERLQETLRPIARCALTTVVAPMGYGKTTAVNWYLSERAKAEDILTIRISVYSDNLAIFWKSVQDAFAHVGLDVLCDYACPYDAAGASLLTDDLCHALGGEKCTFLFIDDFHLLTDNRVPSFICTLAYRLPENVHLILASRDRFLTGEDLVRLGGRVYQIGADRLRLNHTELSAYAHRCGTELTDEQIDSLLYSSEGWFSAIYLNLCALFERGELPDRNSDIYSMFSAAMIDPLPPRQQEFLAVMGLADEFTVEMALAVTESRDAAALIATLTGRNAFVTRLPDGVTYRFHHMMKECAERTFLKLPPEKQRLYRDRYGAWYTAHQQYLHALSAYQKAQNYDGMLDVIQRDAGILLASLRPSDVIDALAPCPEAILMAHPGAILVLMRSMFNWHRIPQMLEMKALLARGIEAHPELSPEERGNLLGESELIMSFLMYNDITQMSRLHRSASAQMSRPAISIRNDGGWTFGSPSVLMMFHRAPGLLADELAEMNDCMPHYYKITNGHGQGAELVMSAEAAYMQGRFSDAHIQLEQAYAQIEGNGQENIALCCDLLAWRLSLCTQFTPRQSFSQRRDALLRRHNAAWLNIYHATSAYYHAILGMPEQIPDMFREHMLSSANLLAPGKPMNEMIENQVYLAQGEYAKVIARSAAQLAVCEAMHYALVALHIRIQTAAAYERLGKRAEARALLTQALTDAAPDMLIMPFAENYPYLKALLQTLPAEPDMALRSGIQKLGTLHEARCAQLRSRAVLPAAFAVLTEREREITALIAQRLSNREIAEKLFLSEGSVKQYVNQIYSKLQIGGDTRTKRRQLLEMLAPNAQTFPENQS